MGKIADNLNAQRPWAWLKMSRAQYERLKPWKKTGLSKAEFGRLVLCIPQDYVQEMHEEAMADKLVEAIFKASQAD